MSVDNQHEDYKRMAAVWKRCDDVACGEDAVHAAAEAYLPKLKEQTSSDYSAYVLRSSFYNATWRTIAGLVGMLFRKPPTLEAPSSLLPYLEDVTMGGIPLQVFAQQISEEALKKGRLGVLVDYPPSEIQEGATVADAEAAGLRPTLALYKAASISNWRTEKRGNKIVLVLVVLVESEVALEDEFTEVAEQRFRVLDLEPETNAYRVRRFKMDGAVEVLLDTVYPLMNGKRLGYIPFIFIGTDDLTPDVDDPPLIDLVNLNLSHYRTTADYEHGCHYTGLPTAWIAGYEIAEGQKLYIGSQSAWVFPNPDAKAGYLEFTGQGLQSLETNLERKEKQMAVLGARMLEDMKRGVESAQTASIHRVGEESVLSQIAQTISMGITSALRIFSAWAGIDGEIRFDLNRDFFPVEMTPEELTSLVAAWQAGGISKETLFNNLKQGEIISSSSTFEGEEAKIANSAPQGTAQ